MIRVFTDFQAIDADGYLFILRLGDEELEQKADELGIKIGDEVILDAHEDFEIAGTLDFRFVNLLNRKSWVANPNWSTRKDKSTPSV